MSVANEWLSGGVPSDAFVVLDERARRAAVELFEVWRSHYAMNMLRSSYYYAHQRVKDFGISVPDAVKSRVWPMIAWSMKAVRALADLSVFEGVVARDAQVGAQLETIAERNNLGEVVSQLIVSAYTHCCAFITVSKTETGEAFLCPRDAVWSAATWDYQRRCIASALTITGTDKSGRVTGFVLWLRGRNVTVWREPAGWRVREVATSNPSGVDVFALAYDAQVMRPFGRSRISRALMSLTDIGVRTMLRMEATAEFYSAPHLWFLGLDSDALTANAWSSLSSAINAVSRDENGEHPSVFQVSQASMQPHSDMLKTVALLVAAETNLPVSDLGITMDNPASAEAMAAAERKLTREADRQNVRFGRALGLALARGVELESGVRAGSGVRVLWRATREVSEGARADFYAKVASVSPSYADSRVGLSRLGLSSGEIGELAQARDDARAQAMVDALNAPVAPSV